MKNVDLAIPKEKITVFTGLSGSGKSSILLEAFPENYPDTIMVGQGSIGVSNRSTLATYMGIMDDTI